ncbi:MAG TPA: glycosyltransferase N-terminal domain-containing protein [Kiloniellaceae bacterium]|nr:glycosyltransferase N-terminal domain-containing protein [Kiloniellaceae bacterium]
MKLTRALWIHLSPAADAEAAVALTEALRARFPRVEIVLTVAAENLRAALARRLPDCHALPPPRARTRAVDRFLTRLDVRLLLLAAPGEALEALLLDRAARRAVPSVALLGWQNPDIATDTVAGKLERMPLAALELLYVRAGAPAPSALRAKALYSPDGAAPDAADDPSRWAPLTQALAPLLARDLKLARSRQQVFRRGLESWLARRLEGGLLRRCLGRRWQRYDSLADLDRALGSPKTILCLGNGPSSEDAQLKTLAHDCLFRVNHNWLERGFMTDAQMVFCGSKVTLDRIPEAIFGLQTLESERRLLGYLLLRILRGRAARFATLSRYDLFFTRPDWAHIRPTNGASMLAAAVALQPDRLIVSGIDLFSHPAGSYPGDSRTPNAYTPGHEPDSELALLLEALKAYRGELTILSDALAQEWQAFNEGDRRNPQHSNA